MKKREYMKHRKLRKTGLDVSIIGLGTEYLNRKPSIMYLMISKVIIRLSEKRLIFIILVEFVQAGLSLKVFPQKLPNVSSAVSVWSVVLSRWT
jgi:hypothetical protein